jgi:hypothetical protein
MAVSLERAAQCIGRSVLHENKNVRGVVDHVTAQDVWVKTTDGDVVPCIPAHLSWLSTLSSNLRNAIVGRESYRDAQVGYAPEVFRDDEVQGFSNLGIVYSSSRSNDDGEDRALYAIPPTLRKVQVLSITANRDTAWEIEEVLGWATA